MPLPFETSHPGLFAVGDVRAGSVGPGRLHTGLQRLHEVDHLRRLGLGTLGDNHLALALLVDQIRNDPLRHAGDFIHLLLQGQAFAQILEVDGAADLGENRERVRVPFGEKFAELDRLIFFDAKPRRRRS